MVYNYPHPAPVVLNNLLTRFSNSSSAGAKQVGRASQSCGGAPLRFLARSQRVFPLLWPVCSGTLPAHSASSDLRVQSTNIFQSVLILLYHLSQVPWSQVRVCSVCLFPPHLSALAWFPEPRLNIFLQGSRPSDSLQSVYFRNRFPWRGL